MVNKVQQGISQIAVICISDGETWNVYRTLVGTPFRKSDTWEDWGGDGRIVLRLILGKQVVRMGNGLYGSVSEFCYQIFSYVMVTKEEFHMHFYLLW